MTLLLSANVAHENYSLFFIGQVDSEKIGGLFSAGHFMTRTVIFGQPFFMCCAAAPAYHSA
jgi:hypothetical protein